MEQVHNSKQNFTVPIIVMFLLFFMIAFVTNFAGSMGVILKGQYDVSPALTQLGSLANFIAYACMGIPAGILLKRKGYKFTSLAAVIVGFVGVGIQLVSGYAGGYAVYVLGAFVAGFSMCMLNIVVNPMLNTLGGGGNRGNQLVQLGGSCNSIGGTIAPILLGYLIGGQMANAKVSDAAPAMIIAMAIFAVAFLVIAFTKIPEPHIETPEERRQRQIGATKKDRASNPLAYRHFVLGALSIFFYVGVEVGIPNIGNLYLSENVSPAAAGFFIGAYWFLMMCGRMIGGAIGNKVSSRSMLITVTTVVLCFIFALMFISESVTANLFGYTIPLGMFFVTLAGLCTSVMWGAIFNLSTEGLGKAVPLASGIFMTLVCGGGILPFIQGLVADRFGYINSYWVVIVGFLFILFYALVGCKNVNKDIAVENE